LRVFESLRRADRDGFAQMVANRSKEVDKTEFIGAEACAGCHASSYEIWKKSRHATAITTLVQKNRHEDLNCIECHVLGFNSKGGYVSEGVTPKFANVQCENCHGPRRLHVQEPTKKPIQSSVMDPNKSCQECHTPPHSPGFEQKKYWKAIEHK
jgi:mono/diheme cytochrome c family protein